MEATCSGGHAHASGQRGREYPEKLRKAIAESRRDRGGVLTRFGAPEALPAEVQVSYSRAAAGRQPRGAKYPPLIPEFKEMRRLELPATMVQGLGLLSASHRRLK